MYQYTVTVLQEALIPLEKKHSVLTVSVVMPCIWVSSTKVDMVCLSPVGYGV